MKPRREFLKAGVAVGASMMAARLIGAESPRAAKPFLISLAQWSLHRAFLEGGRDARAFPRIAKQEFGIDAVEYVNQFYFDTLTDSLVRELRTQAEGEGVRSLLIMCDGEGRLGAPDEDERRKTVANHHRWADAARALGCHSIRVNAASEGTFEEQQKLAAAGLRVLADYCAPLNLDVLVENHGGLSSNGRWLAGVMRLAGHPNVGTLPDFGNFVIDRSTGERYDAYLGVEELMPFAKAVSAKTNDFDDATGEESVIDYSRMMRLVLAAGYHGYVGIEYEGTRLGEAEGILATKRLLERLQKSLAAG